MSVSLIKRAWWRIRTALCHFQYKHIKKSSSVHYTAQIYNPDNLYMEEMTNIDGGAVVMNARAKLVFKKNSGAAVGLLAITGNHMSVVGKNLKQINDKIKDELDVNHEMDKDIIVEEDVWIGCNVTLLSGAHLGRSSVIAAGAVVTSDIPPYCIAGGVPAKPIKFKWTIDQILEHESILYPEEERFSREELERIFAETKTKADP